MTREARLTVFLSLWLLSACARSTPVPTLVPTPAPETVNLDAETQALIASAERAAFIVPFSHWDTDWHEAFPAYVQRSDRNILIAMQMAKENPRFRYTLEQVLFVRHFWDAYPEERAGLRALIEKRQITFAWAGITQPETSLAAPAIQVRNWQLGRDWIAETFGEAYVPRTAWQSDAFGNSAAFPEFLARAGIPYLFIGRWQYRCNPEVEDCTPLPLHFYWKSPAAEARVLAAYVFYSDAWGDIFRAGDDEARQLAALQAYVAEQFERTTSRYAFIPMGFDFLDPLPQLMRLVERNNADSQTVFVVSDPETAFRYVATQDLPEFAVDLNPIWQGFYGSRPFAKIADKESDYVLTAADKFGLLIDAPPSTAWLTATMNAHYDNLGAVSFDRVWESAQRPRFEQTLATAADDLAATLARIAGGVQSPLVVFNPTSWARSEIVEIEGELPDVGALPAPVQTLGPDHVAFRAGDVPGIGYAAANGGAAVVAHPAALTQNAGLTILQNGLVSVTLDPALGGTFMHLSANGGPNLLAAPGDDVAYWDDTGDIYGARFGAERARESRVRAQITALAEGPLIARAQVTFTLGGQPLTKTVTLRSDSPLIEVALEIRALPETSAVLHIPTTLNAQTRTDDLGFLTFEHSMDDRPIAPGDITYRRKIFYPITYWSDVSAAGSGLALITHGLQGVGGMSGLSLLLVRSVTDEDGEGLTDPDTHTLRYAYLPHAGTAPAAQVWRAAYAFNQPLIPAWRAGDALTVQIPFAGPRRFPIDPTARPFPDSDRLLSAEGGLVADVFRRNGRTEAFVIPEDPSAPVTLTLGASQFSVAGASPLLVPVEVR
jgi:hypothetical protein